MTSIDTDLELGMRQRTFCPGSANLFAGMALGLSMITGGAWIGHHIWKRYDGQWQHIPVFANRGESWVHAGVLLLLMIGLTVVGLGLILWVRSFSKRRVHVFENGLLYETRSDSRRYQWDEIAEVEETILYEKLPLLSGPAQSLIPSKKSSSYIVRHRNRTEFQITRTTIQDVDDLARLIRQQTDPRGVPWNVIEVSA